MAADHAGRRLPLAFPRRMHYNLSPMHRGIEILIGCVVVGFSLASIAGLTLWSRRIIERIADSGRQTARHLIKQLNGDE